MRKISRFVLTFALVAIIAAPLMAQEKKGKKKKKQGNRNFSVLRLPKTIDLTGEQKEKIAAINKEIAPKFRAIFQKQNKILSDEQRKARREAQQAARKDKKRGKAARDAINAATNLTDDQKKQMAEIAKERTTLFKAARAKIVEVLTAEQRSKLKRPAKKKGKKKKRKKKKDADK